MAEQSSSFIKRVLSSVVLIPVLLFILYLGYPYTGGLLGVLFCLCAWEWLRLCVRAKKITSPFTKSHLSSAGLLYLATSFYALVIISQESSLALFGLLIMVWASDTGAYLVGSLVGGPKLCPSISPNKTWSGFVGGLILTIAAGYVLITQAHWSLLREQCADTLSTMVSVGLVAIISPLGDLLESWMKRRFGVKDTGNLIPGHGGALDRLDSITAVGFILFLLIMVCPLR